MHLPRRSVPFLVAAVALAAANGCSSTVDTHGAVLRESVVAQLRPGVHTQDDVVQLLGSPSSKAPFDPGTWYYIGEKSEYIAFFDPKVTERKVLVLRFDETGRLASMGSLSAEDGKQVAFVERETPTAGHELGFIEQLLGNMGRFNAPNTRAFGRGPGGGF